MFRKLIFPGCLALAVASVAYAQQPTAPPIPEDALSPRELIAWTSLQIPRPAQVQIPAVQIQPYELIQDPAKRGPQLTTDSQVPQDHAKSQSVTEPSAQVTPPR